MQISHGCGENKSSGREVETFSTASVLDPAPDAGWLSCFWAQCVQFLRNRRFILVCQVIMHAHGYNYWSNPSTPIPKRSKLDDYSIENKCNLADLSETFRLQFDEISWFRTQRGLKVLENEQTELRENVISSLPAKKTPVENKNHTKKRIKLLKNKTKNFHLESANNATPCTKKQKAAKDLDKISAKSEMFYPTLSEDEFMDADNFLWAPKIMPLVSEISILSSRSRMIVNLFRKNIRRFWS